MEIDLAEERRQAHLLVDWLPEGKLAAVRGPLEVMVEPMSLAQSLAMAPMDDEELTDEMVASLMETKESMARGEYVSHEEVLRELGL